jgi:hypothetical protein
VKVTDSYLFGLKVCVSSNMCFSKEVEWEIGDKILLAKDRNESQALLNTVMNLWVLQKAANLLTS